MPKIKYNDLPMLIRQEVPEDDFLVGYLSSDVPDSNVIVRTLDPTLNRPIESEYNQLDRHKLSLAARGRKRSIS